MTSNRVSYLFTSITLHMLTTVTYSATGIYYNATINGNSVGAPCVFPFYYNGLYYNDCVSLNHTALWCSTTENLTRDGQWGECPNKDVCQSPSILSNPWRNIGFNSSAFALNDSALQESWYHFSGIGGDRMVYSCLKFCLSDTADLVNFTDLTFNWGSSGDTCAYTCDLVVDSMRYLDCGGGLVMYYLMPTDGVYRTRHSSCSVDSCGVNAQCSPEGGCMCNSGLIMYNGFLPNKDTYGCTDLNVTLPKECKVHCSQGCAEDLLTQILSRPVQVIPKDIVEIYLEEKMNCVKVLENATTDCEKIVFYADSVLKATEKLISAMVIETDTYNLTTIMLQTLEVQLFAVGPHSHLKKIPQLVINNSSLEVDLIGISKNNNGSAAVAFFGYTNQFSMTSPCFFNTDSGTVRTLMSNVVSVTFPHTNNTQLTSPMNFTLKHIYEGNPEGTLICMAWQKSEWVDGKCDVIKINSSYSKCSCVYPATFALIMQTGPSSGAPSKMEYLFSVAAVAVGLVFLSLTLLTFILCRRNARVTNVALFNMCLSLLLAHLLFLLTQHFLVHIYEVLCKVLAGILHFFFLSSFVWMSIDSVLLFISVRNLSKIKSMQREVLSGTWLTVIGYTIPLLIVGVSVGIVPDGYDSKQSITVQGAVLGDGTLLMSTSVVPNWRPSDHGANSLTVTLPTAVLCWIKMELSFLWSFLGPVAVILSLNLILFIIISFLVVFTLRGLNNEILQKKRTAADRNLIRTVMFKTLLQFFIIGCPWVLGFFTKTHSMLLIPFLFFNSQQGTFIFFVHCVFNQEVRQQYKKWFCHFQQKTSQNSAETNADQQRQKRK